MPSHPLSSPSPPASNHFQHQGLSNESTLRMRWPKYWSFSFSISPSKEHPGLISFRMDWLDLLAVQGTLESSPTPQFKSINSSALSFLHCPTLTSICEYWPWITVMMNGLPWKQTEIILSFLRLHPSTAVWTLLTVRATPFLLSHSVPVPRT